jgi:hypothetical protein
MSGSRQPDGNDMSAQAEPGVAAATTLAPATAGARLAPGNRRP